MLLQPTGATAPDSPSARSANVDDQRKAAALNRPVHVDGKSVVSAVLAQQARDSQYPLVLEEVDVTVEVDSEGVLRTVGKSPRGWSMSCCQMSRLGHPPPLKDRFELTVVPALTNEKVIGVAADGEQSAFFAIGKYRLWSWGSQQNCLLGNGTGNETPVQYEPNIILDLAELAEDRNRSSQHLNAEQWVQVSAGMRHGAALTSHGRLFTWGSAHWGAGHPGPDDQPRPEIPEPMADKHIVYVHCPDGEYDNATLAVDRDGVVYRPKFNYRTNECPWIHVPVTPAVMRALGIRQPKPPQTTQDNTPEPFMRPKHIHIPVTPAVMPAVGIRIRPPKPPQTTQDNTPEPFLRPETSR
jgi:hypothetical protein